MQSFVTGCPSCAALRQLHRMHGSSTAAWHRALTDCEAEHLVGEEEQPLAHVAREGQHEQEGQNHGRGQQEVDKEPPSCTGSRQRVAAGDDVAVRQAVERCGGEQLLWWGAV